MLFPARNEQQCRTNRIRETRSRAQLGRRQKHRNSERKRESPRRNSRRTKINPIKARDQKSHSCESRGVYTQTGKAHCYLSALPMLLTGHRLRAIGTRLLLVTLLWLGCAHWPAIAASFDCNTSQLTTVEMTICADPVLSALDSRLASIYLSRTRQAAPAEKSQLVRAEKNWLSRRNTCSTHECLREAYDSQISSLSSEPQNASASIPNPASPRLSTTSPPETSSADAPGSQNTPIQIPIAASPALAATSASGASANEVSSGFPSSILIWLAVAVAFVFIMVKSPSFRRGFFNALFRRASGPHSPASSNDRVRGYCVYEVSQSGLLCRFPVPGSLSAAIDSAKSLKSRNPRANYVVCEVRSSTSEPGATAFSI